MTLVNFSSHVTGMDNHLDQPLHPLSRLLPIPLPLLPKVLRIQCRYTQRLWVGVHDVTARYQCPVLSPEWLDVSG